MFSYTMSIAINQTIVDKLKSRFIELRSKLMNNESPYLIDVYFNKDLMIVECKPSELDKRSLIEEVTLSKIFIDNREILIEEINRIFQEESIPSLKATSIKRIPFEEQNLTNFVVFFE